MNNIASVDKAKKLGNICTASCICHISPEIDGHNQNFSCHCFSRLESFILSWRIMDTSQFQTKVYFVAHSDKNFLELKNLCVLLDSQVGCTKGDIGNFTNMLSAFFDKLDKTVLESWIFSCSVARCLKKLFYLYLILVNINNIVWTCDSC